MKKKLGIIFLSISLIFQACNNASPSIKDISGNWIGEDGAQINLNSKGTFIAKSFPAALVFLPPQEYVNQKFNGNGNWILKKEQNEIEIYVTFLSTSEKKYMCAFPIKVEGKNGFFGTRPPWYLFLWKDEEGGNKYEFKKLKD